MLSLLYIISALSLLALYIIHRLLRNYQVLRSLHLPGPLSAKLSSKWLLTYYVRGQRMNVVHSLHLKHGSVVQVGPQELSFCSATACRDIYGLNTLALKSKIYNSFGPPSLFTFRDKEIHRERKKRISHVFAPSAIRDYEAGMQSQISRYIDAIRERKGKEFDIVGQTRLLALDIAGEILLGQSFEAFGARDLPYFVQVMNFVHPMFALSSEVPWLVWGLEGLGGLGVRWARDFAGSVDYVYGYGQQRMRESIAQHGRRSHQRNLLTKLIAGDPGKGTLPLSDEDIGYEVANFIYAGTDTTAMSISYLLYELASHVEWQERLRKEIIEAGLGKKEKGWSYDILKGLSVFQACVHESMRLHPGIGPGLPRVTPKEGMIIDGLFVPGNTAISVPMLDLQRNPTIFHDPDTFNPGRWLSTSDSSQPKFSHTPEMQAHMFLWGGGEYSCAGQNMAIMEIKILVSRVIGEFAVRLEGDGKGTHRDMEMCDHLVVAPRGGKGMLMFEKLEGEVV